MQLKHEKFQTSVEDLRELLASSEISIVITAFERWELPSAEELHRLGRVSGYPIPEVFGPTEVEQAISKFGEGDIKGCMDIFAGILADKESSQIRNNLAFCQMVTGDIVQG